MQFVKTFLLSISIGLLPTILFSPINSDTTICYIDSIKDGESVFRRPFEFVTFNGGPLAFKNVLIKQINHNRFFAELSKSQPSFSDTARIKMIISKMGTMSNLHIEGTKNDHFKSEIIKLIQSACFWIPAGMNGRKVNVWNQFDVFYFIELTNGELKINVSFKWYPYVENRLPDICSIFFYANMTKPYQKIRKTLQSRNCGFISSVVYLIPGFVMDGIFKPTRDFFQKHW